MNIRQKNKLAQIISHNENIREHLPRCTYCQTSQEDVILVRYRNEPICPKCLRDEVYEGDLTLEEYTKIIETKIIDNSAVKELLPEPDIDFI